MATIGPRQTVAPPPARPWRPNLIAASRAAQTYITSPVTEAQANEVPDGAATSDVNRWGSGIAYRPELSFMRPDPEGEEGDTIEGPGEYIECAVEGETDQADKVAVAGHGAVEWDPYVLYDGDTCTTMGSDYDITRERAVSSLTRQTSHLLENVLWTGVVNGEDFTTNHPNTALASSDADLPNGTSTVGVVTAVGLMVEELSVTLGGLQGMIHVPAYLIPLLDFYGLITRVGDTNMLFAGDHMIVTGTGYDGSGPSGQSAGILEGQAWIYGTSLVAVRLSGIFAAPSEAQVYVDMDTNDIIVLAERLALAEWDRTAHIGVNVDLTDPGPAVTTSS